MKTAISDPSDEAGKPQAADGTVPPFEMSSSLVLDVARGISVERPAFRPTGGAAPTTSVMPAAGAYPAMRPSTGGAAPTTSVNDLRAFEARFQDLMRADPEQAALRSAAMASKLRSSPDVNLVTYLASRPVLRQAKRRPPSIGARDWCTSRGGGAML